jgi:hypothetical protein
MVSTRIGGLIYRPDRIKIWIGFGFEIFAAPWISHDSAHAIADWLEANGRDHGAVIVRGMLRCDVVVSDWSEPLRQPFVGAPEAARE